jgi:hypothetical protein
MRWLYEFQAEAESRRDRLVMRPLVPVSLGDGSATPPLMGLVDTGAEHTLAAGWIADLIGVGLAGCEDRLRLGIGGSVVDVAFVEVNVRLHAPAGADTFEWRADVGLVDAWRPLFPVPLGQTGFLDQFTITHHRGAGLLVVEPWEALDARFGAHISRD